MSALCLSLPQLGQSWPCFVHLDAELRLRDWGPGLHAAFRAEHRGQLLAHCCTVLSPAALPQAWLDGVDPTCRLIVQADSPALLQAPVLALQDGGFLVCASALQTTASTDAAAAGAPGRAEAMLALLDAGVAYFDDQDRLCHHNPRMAQLLGALPGELTGLSLDMFEDRLAALLTPGDMQRHPISDLLVAEGAGEADANMLLRRDSPNFGVLELQLRTAAQGAHVVVLRDVTRETEVDQMKSDFLSSAAHELRTPMASILGYSELLLHRKMGEAQQKEALQTVHRQSQLMMRIINELLDLARIEARQGRDMDRRPTALAQILDQLKQSQDEKDRQHPLAWPLEVPDCLLLVDEVKTVRALSEVLDNACQFSPEGSPVTLVVQDEDPQWLSLEIRDRGIGMSPQECAKVGERFWRADPQRSSLGTGLGMALVRDIVDLQGGWLDVQSVPGEGTTVRISFPVLHVALDGPAIDDNSEVATTGAFSLDAPHPR